LGAETTVDTGSGLEAQVRGRWQDGVDACIDTIGLGAAALVCVRDGGTFVTSVPTAVPDQARGIAPQTVQVQPDAEALTYLAGAAGDGELTVRVAEVLPLERFRDGYERLARGGLRGKIVLSPQPS
jgi:NADPH:quinone reductase